MARKKRQTGATKPFDATTKNLVELSAKDWLDFLGLPATEFELVNADLSTVTTDADRVILVTAPARYGVHQEFQAAFDETLPERCLRYNVLAAEKLGAPIVTVAVLLRPDADRQKSVTGYLERKDHQGRVYLTFRYNVVKVWEIPVEEILKGGLALLPYAPLCDLAGTTPAETVKRMAQRLDAEVIPSSTERLLLMTTYLLLGLRYKPEEMVTMLEMFGARIDLRDSVTYQKIRNEGRAEEAQSLLLIAGEGRFGKPDDATEKRIRQIPSAEQLEEMMRRLFAVESWGELLKQ